MYETEIKDTFNNKKKRNERKREIFHVIWGAYHTEICSCRHSSTGTAYTQHTQAKFNHNLMLFMWACLLWHFAQIIDIR